MTQSERLHFLIDCLTKSLNINDFNHLPPRQTLRALMNVWDLSPLPDEFWQVQDAFLQSELTQRQCVRLDDLRPVSPDLPNIYLWQGDITRLQIDAIVNAGNAQLLGCFAPLHGCIDNAIHSHAGLQLRANCAKLMRQQGLFEPTGNAKITPAYNLPSRFVLHTVGPIIQHSVTKIQKNELANCYLSCLNLAKNQGLTSVAFCCISTGEFRFPNELAGKIATDTVKAFLVENPSMQVVFNVFKEVDLKIYQEILC